MSGAGANVVLREVFGAIDAVLDGGVSGIVIGTGWAPEWSSTDTSTAAALSPAERRCLTTHHGLFSGILCTAIVGGAFVSLAVGCWARPLVNNATISFRELFASVGHAVTRFRGPRASSTP